MRLNQSIEILSFFFYQECHEVNDGFLMRQRFCIIDLTLVKIFQ